MLISTHSQWFFQTLSLSVVFGVFAIYNEIGVGYLLIKLLQGICSNLLTLYIIHGDTYYVLLLNSIHNGSGHSPSMLLLQRINFTFLSSTATVSWNYQPVLYHLDRLRWKIVLLLKDVIR
jgi:hypothetical protein